MNESYTFEVVLLVLAAIIIPSVTWLIKEVIALRKDLIKMKGDIVQHKSETALLIKAITNNCERHQHWQEKAQRSQQRTERNIVKICTKMDIEPEAENHS